MSTHGLAEIEVRGVIVKLETVAAAILREIRETRDSSRRPLERLTG